MFREGINSGIPYFDTAGKAGNKEETKTMVFIAIFVFAIILLFIFYIYQRIEVREVVYNTNNLQAAQKKLIEENRELQLEISSLRSLERIENIAQTQLKLTNPADVRMLTLRKKPGGEKGDMVWASKSSK